MWGGELSKQLPWGRESEPRGSSRIMYRVFFGEHKRYRSTSRNVRCEGLPHRHKEHGPASGTLVTEIPIAVITNRGPPRESWKARNLSPTAWWRSTGQCTRSFMRWSVHKALFYVTKKSSILIENQSFNKYVTKDYWFILNLVWLKKSIWTKSANYRFLGLGFQLFAGIVTQRGSHDSRREFSGYPIFSYHLNLLYLCLNHRVYFTIFKKNFIFDCFFFLLESWVVQLPIYW